MSEKLELVTDFGSLRAGMLVVAKDCQMCHRNARGIINGPREMAGIAKDGSIRSAMAFLLLPGCCNPVGMVFGKSSVTARRIWRVEDGLETSFRSTARKPKKLARSA